ncbi:haloacid dehalogenase [Jannaschia pagri]|uniref:(S)-2-haloacid dehalogenase n=1 Tax=Jannaschia pagri TaxID=2829797 RepID=A0ABQ4NK16_9RHOB|nr:MULTISPECIES: haloacid dehalogenase type II [unclassified Jannaschia]GIT90927.1 haloacid dehalogenase [Jannaschia sp. AI_61]GIT94758.1 haloacid dehalogenase [Jannaschia sp. AI_62]
MPIDTCIFDAYGTLFDVTAAAREAAAEDGFEALADTWQTVARDWREKQLQYTWLRAVTGEHVDFWQVTGDGLDWALEAADLSDPKLRDRLMQLYWDLTAYPEVPDMLGALKDAHKATGILSNGSPEMLQGAVTSAGIGRLLDHVLSVESVGVFKPSSKVYDMVSRAFACEAGNVLFVSSNGWDAAAAKGYGFTTVWVNRQGLPMDRLDHRPDHVLPDLSSLPALVGSL